MAPPKDQGQHQIPAEGEDAIGQRLKNRKGHAEGDGQDDHGNAQRGGRTERQRMVEVPGEPAG